MLLLHLDGALYTGNAQATLDDVVRRAQEAGPGVHAVVLEGSAVHVVSVTMIDTFRSMQEELLTEGVTLMLAGFPPETLEVMRRSRWFAEAEADVDSPSRPWTLPSKRQPIRLEASLLHHRDLEPVLVVDQVGVVVVAEIDHDPVDRAR